MPPLYNWQFPHCNGPFRYGPHYQWPLKRLYQHSTQMNKQVSAVIPHFHNRWMSVCVDRAINILFYITSNTFKGTFHPKFCHYFLTFMLFKTCSQWQSVDSSVVLDPTDFHQNHILKNFLLCFTDETKSYRFETTGIWENNDRILIFGWILKNVFVYTRGAQ